MNIKIQRNKVRGEFVHGKLFIEGASICSTLENSNGLVPAGDSPIHLIKCKQYARKMICLNPKAPCSKCKKLPFVCMNTTLPCWCPQIKPGNGIHDRFDGSILVGEYNCLNSLIHPKKVFDQLYERIRKSISRGNQVILTIKDPSNPSNFQTSQT